MRLASLFYILMAAEKFGGDKLHQDAWELGYKLSSWNYMSPHNIVKPRYTVIL